jgi:Domain of unknown function (DUF4349)
MSLGQGLPERPGRRSNARKRWVETRAAPLYRDAMRRILVIGVVALSALSLAGCTASSGSSSSADSSSEVAPGPAAGAVTDTASGADVADPTTTDRQVVTTGTATITAKDPVTAADRAISIVTSVGGRVDAQQQKAPVDGDRGSASVTLRIPSAQLTGVLDRLRKLGTVQSVQLAADDVTPETQDLGARITAQRASVGRLIALLGKADTTKDLIALENAVSDRQGSLESMEAQQRSLDDQVDLATITVSFVSVADAPVRGPDTFGSGLATGWRSFVEFAAGTLVVIGVLLPWLAFLAALAAIAIVVVRLRTRRRRLVGEP